VKDRTKKELFESVQIMMEQYCKGCFLHQHLKKEFGKRAAHRFCITDCTVGEKLREFGERLS
jgi:hypothetical protein